MGIKMTDLQLKLLDILIEFDHFCRTHHITYYMLGGTMLGAYRHKGFIPWDDDIDIGIPRKEYERFIRLANKKLRNKYCIRNRRLEKNVPFVFTHMEDQETTCIEQRRCKDTYAGGVYIEIFPLDGGANSYIEQKIHAFFVRLLKKVFYAFIMDYDQKHRSFYKAWIIQTIRKMFTMDQVSKMIEGCIQKFDLESSRYMCNHLGHWGRKENIPKLYMYPPKEYLFEGKSFYGVSRPEKYLTCLYGNQYMTPPSRKEQEEGKHPAYYLNLELPYREYKENKGIKHE